MTTETLIETPTESEDRLPLPDCEVCGGRESPMIRYLRLDGSPTRCGRHLIRLVGGDIRSWCYEHRER